MGKHAHAIRDLFRGSELIGPMAYPTTARHKNHRRGTDARHEQRIVIGAARQLVGSKSSIGRTGLQDIPQTRIHGFWQVGGYNLKVYPNPPSRGNPGSVVAYPAKDTIPPRPIDVAHIYGEPNLRWNPIDRPGEDRYLTDRSDGINASSSAGGRFHAEDQFGRRSQRIVSIRHQQAAGMSALAGDHCPDRRRRRDRGHHPDWQAKMLKHRTLLNVQFQKGMVGSLRNPDVLQGPGPACLTACLLDPVTFPISQGTRLVW